MVTERTEQRADGTVERTTSDNDRQIIVERGGSGVGAIIALVIGVVAVLVVGYFLMNMSRNDAIETNAVTAAAESVGNAADNVGAAASSANPSTDR